MRFRFFGLAAFLLIAAICVGQVSKGKIAPRDLPFTPVNKWALVIGANDYTELGKLNYAAKDAKAFADTLRERFGYQPESINLIIDGPESKDKPTIDTITKALDRQLADPRLSDGDLFIFYFSGHGIGTPTGDYLMPTDAKKDNADQVGLNVKQIVQRFVKAGLRNVLFIVDACRGGEKNDFGDDLRSLGKQANIAVILGCEPGARSYEYPQLGHGAFTSFLLKSLKNTELQSQVTGTLWASKVAADVGQKVRDYTARDYPERPQTPTGWSEPTMDVLLGAFPRKGAARLKLADIMAETERLDKQEHVDSLRRFASEMYAQERWAEAVEAWRTVDGIRRLSSFESLQVALALGFQGKTFEMENELAKLGSGDKNDLYTHLAVLNSPSRKIRPEQRVSAAKEAWRIEPASWIGLLCFATLQTYDAHSDAQAFLGEVLKLKDLKPRMRLYFEGYQEANAGNWDSAEQKWEASRESNSDFPNQTAVDASILQAIVFRGQTDRLQPFLKRAAETSNPNEAAFWYLMLAQYQREKKLYDDMIGSIDKALDQNISADDLLRAIQIAGLRFPVIQEKVIKQADEKPFAWKAMIAKILVSALGKGQEAIADAFLQAEKYCDDEFAIILETYKIFEIQLAEAFEAGAISAEVYSELMVNYSGIMAANVDKFGYDSSAWILFNSFAVNAEKLEQLSRLYDVYLGPRSDDGTLDPMLRAPYLFAVLQMGDTKRVEQIWKLGGMTAYDQVDAGWLVSMYFAAKGDLVRARSLVPKKQSSEVFRETMRAYQAYLDVREGKMPNLEALIPKSRPFSSAMHWLALAYAHQGKWEPAMKILDEFIMKRQQGFFFLHAKASSIYHQRLLSTKRFDEANQHAYQISISGYGNPIYRGIHFGPKAELAAFAGLYEFDGAEFDVLPEMDRGTLSFTIDAKGNLTGKSVMGAKTRAIAGKVDEFGNFRAQAEGGEKAWLMTGKIAPIKIYKSMTEFSTGAQAFLLLDAKGQARYMIARPK